MLKQDSLIKYHEQLPPQNNLAEEIVLGGILVNTEVMQLAINELVTESFSLETHQIIYRTIVEVYIKTDYVDSIILINTLWDLNLLNHIGGIRKVLNLLKNAQIFISQEITYPTAHYYICIIKDKYLRRLLIQHGYHIIKLAHITSIQPTTLLTKTNKYLEHINSQYNHTKDSNISEFLSNLLLNLKGEYQGQYQKQLMSGFKDLDTISHGFKNGDLIVVAGRPSMGKTSFSLNIATNILEENTESVCIFSLEMSREQIIYKLLSILARVPISKLQAGKITNLDWINIQQAARKLVQSQIHINDKANMSLNNLITTAKTLQHACKNLQLIIIDYLQLIQFEKSSISNRAEELSYITRSLKILAKELHLPIIVLSQLNRNVEARINKRPMLSDLRESGCIGYYNTIIQQPYSINRNIKDTKQYGKSILPNIKKKQRLDHVPCAEIQKTDIQYTYSVKHLTESYCQLTHNHKILTHTGWYKIDHMKQYNMIQYSSYSYNNYNQILHAQDQVAETLCITANFMASDMYDLTIDERQCFICNSRYILHNSIEQDADLVLMLYRESYYQNDIDQDTKIKQITNLIIAKHRNGPTGNIELEFNPTLSSFHNL